MDREILFRGKFGDEWKYGYLSVEPKGLVIKEPYELNQSNIWHINPETVGQYTGLLDKNGKKIFEGDILKCHDNPKDLVKVVFGEFGVVDTDTECPVDTVIGWHYEVIPTDELSTVEPFCLSMPLTKSYIEYCHMEVIGNVHDNPELLEVSE